MVGFIFLLRYERTFFREGWIFVWYWRGNWFWEHW